jgi:hypothetical protein
MYIIYDRFKQNINDSYFKGGLSSSKTDDNKNE